MVFNQIPSLLSDALHCKASLSRDGIQSNTISAQNALHCARWQTFQSNKASLLRDGLTLKSLPAEQTVRHSDQRHHL